MAVGLAHEMRRRGMSVSCCVIGPNLLQASILRRLTGRWVRTIDERLLTPGQNVLSVYWAGIGADVVLILGRGGLYDGNPPGSWKGSDAEVASLTRTPAVLVIDGGGWGSSLAALVKGFGDLARGFEIAGALFTRVGEDGSAGQRERDAVSQTLEAYSLPRELGVLSTFSAPAQIPEGAAAQSRSSTLLPVQFFTEAGAAIARSVNIEGLMERAAHVASVRINDFEYKPVTRRCRIAVSDDSCFNLCFQDNLDLLRYFGAEIVTFSPLADSGLPKKVGAVYITGGYLAEYGPELAANQSMKRALREFAGSGGVVYSEGSGSAYLCSRFNCTSECGEIEGVGLIPAVASFKGLTPLAYRDLTTVEESVLGRTGLACRGIVSENWELIQQDHNLPRVFRVTQSGCAAQAEGCSPGAQVVAMTGYNHFGSCPSMARNLVEAAEVVARI